MALAGCGGGDSDGGSEGSADKPGGPALSSFIGKLPVGYRYAPAPSPALERAFRAKVARDFGASPDGVEIRNVYLGAQFVAGIAAVRAGRPFTPAAVANKVVPGHLRTRGIEIAGKRALLVVGEPGAGEPDVAIVDTVGRVILIVTAQRSPVARRVAAGIVR